jgi:hypothetical protein
MSRLLSMLFPLVVLATALPGSTYATDVTVTSGAGLTTALASAAPGDVIQLAAGTYPKLTIGNRRFTGVVHIVGSPAVKLSGLSIADSSGLSFENLTITPTDRPSSRLTVDGSSSIVFDHVHFIGIADAGVELDIGRDSQNIRILTSEFTSCKAENPCLQPGGRTITVLNTRFHDCFDCDMIRGGGSDVTLDGNTFERAVKGSGKNHNDLIQIMGGGPWTIARNRFGDHKGGSAQIFANPTGQNSSNPIHDVTVTSNLFNGESGYAIFIGAGQKSVVGAPRAVRIVNNTILSGKTAALRIGEPFADVAPEARPMVANNILGISSSTLCGLIRASRNLVLTGKGCQADELGSANLDASGSPTAVSSLVIDRADPTQAPATDFFGHARRGLPDIGAIEYGGIAATPLRLTAPARVGLRLNTLRARHWIVTVRVGLAGADQLRARLLRGNRLVASSTRKAAGKTRIVLSLRVPIWARHPGALKLTLRAVANDGRAVSRTVRVTLAR